MKTVMCFGTFDILHVGHLDYFQQAKQSGDRLIVVIARDETKQKQKKEIIFTELERLELVKNLQIVDEAVLGYPDDHLTIIEEKAPDVICLGYDHKIDQKILAQRLQARGLNPEIKRMNPYQVNKHKTSKIKEIMLKS